MNSASNFLFGYLILVFFSCTKEASTDFSVRLNAIPNSAKIIFHEHNLIYTMDENGENITQITFDNSRVLEHVAVSHDRTKIALNYFSNPSIGGISSKVLVLDLSQKTIKHILPNFEMAGNGGVDSDAHGNIYFSAISEFPFANPTTIEEYKANAGANDIYRIAFDGSGLLNLTNTSNYGEADVSVSPNSNYISYMATNITNPEASFTEIWIRDINGDNPQLIYVGGQGGISSVHDPEISPDEDYVIFSQVNSNVPPNFPNNPLANTAHDIIKVNLAAINTITVITQPGPISIIPDWKGTKILFLEITDKTNPPHAGIALINQDGSDYQLIKNGANIGKWIPN